MPSSTPAGIFTVSVRRERTRPSPEHSRHGSGMIVPNPRQAAHGRRVRISPRNDRCTWATSPAPRHVSHGTGCEPAAVPSPWQVVHTTAVSTLSSRATPNAASARSISSRISASAGGAAGTRLAAEEGVHDVGEREAGALAEAGTAERVAAAVVGGPLLRVAQHLVGV